MRGLRPPGPYSCLHLRVKELFLSAMMEWIGDQVSGRASGSMFEALLGRAAILREQLSDAQGPQPRS